MTKAITFCLVIVGLINFAPVLGIVSAQQLESAYSVSLADPDLAILMRHRALLLGILGTFTLCAAFVTVYQKAAMLMTGVSMAGFALLGLATGGYNPALANVLVVDLVGLVFLAIAIILKFVSRVK